MIDINERALNLARSNAELNDVDVNIFESDIYGNIDKKYDYIITNPPIRVGKKILYEILIGAKEHLKEIGMEKESYTDKELKEVLDSFSEKQKVKIR